MADDQEKSNQSRMADDDQLKSNQSRTADDHDFDFWDDDLLNEAIQLTEAAACSFSSNPTQPPQPQQVFRPPPQSVISYSPPRELSQRVKQQDSDKAFHEDKCSKQQEINRLKDELGRVSKVLANLEQECSELRKDREKNEKHLRPVLPVNGSEDAETFGSNKSTLKNKDPVEDPSVSLLKTKEVGDGHGISTDLAIKKNISVSRKLAGIWEPEPRSNLVSKLFVACEADLQILFGFLGLNIPSTTKMASNHCIQSAEAAKVSHLYITLTKISYDTGKLGDLLEALVDLSCLQNMMIVHRSLCVLHVVLKHILNMENKLCRRDNVIITANRSSEMGHMLNPVLTSAKKESQPLISCSKWFSLFQIMHQVVRRQCEENIRVEAVSIMNILLLRTDAYTEREMYGEVSVFESIPQLLRKEAGLGVQKQAVHLLYFLLNCPSLMLMFCSSSKEEGTSAAFQVLDGLADCLACHGNGAPTNLVLKLQRNTIVLLAFLASSGRSGFEILLGRNISRRTNFLYLILQIMASEIDVETSEHIQPPEDSRERTLLIREALILLNRLVSNSQYSAPVLRLLTNRRDMAVLTVDIASRLSRKNKRPWQSDTMTRQMRESEIVDLARIFKKRVFTFLGDAT
ncbi:hypothetical protein Hdeb2414_s0009g00317611 [Helianthus debilis subsp. tardiflorus]